MGTKISWADESWNPIIGCSKTSVGCANCYAEKMAHRLSGMGVPFYDMVQEEGCWNGNVEFVESALTKPLHWRNPRKIFVCSMSDLFHDSVPFEWIDRVFAVMALCPQHEFKVLTKRAGRMREYIEDIKTPIRIAGAASQGARATISLNKLWAAAGWPILNVHLGVTVENQENVNRIADLIRTPAAARFISFEPLLERVGHIHYVIVKCSGCGQRSLVNLDISDGSRDDFVTACFDCMEHRDITTRLDYAFIGCESGPRARLCNLDDIRYVIEQCALAGINRHVKQIPLNGKCNKNIDEWPEEFQVRKI